MRKPNNFGVHLHQLNIGRRMLFIPDETWPAQYLIISLRVPNSFMQIHVSKKIPSGQMTCKVET